MITLILIIIRQRMLGKYLIVQETISLSVIRNLYREQHI